MIIINALISLNSILFLPLLLLVFVAYHFVIRRPVQRPWALFAASILFYLGSSPRFLPLFVAMTLIVSWLGKKVSGPLSRRARTAYLSAGIAVPLGALLFFKAHWNNQFDWAAPLGISYFTLQMIGYVIDCSEGAVAPANACSLQGSLTFFPIVSSGPITAVRSLSPQIESGRTPSWTELKRGFLLYSNGLLKKMIADSLTGLPATRYLARNSLGPVAAWANLFRISAKFYADFSGYTDMALGIALLFGIELPENFRLPFLAHSAADHWRRWHITLGVWFRQYVFMPLASAYGRHPGVSARTFWLLGQINIMIVMLLIGVWHGFTVSFAIWGLLNGALIVISPWFDRVRSWGIAGHILAVAMTFYLTTLARVFTYAVDPRFSLRLLASAHTWRTAPAASPTDVVDLLIAVLAVLVPHSLDWLILEKKQWIDQSRLTWAMILLFWVIVLTFGSPTQPFVYIQM